jgi:trehalose/maltose transport system permease protein
MNERYRRLGILFVAPSLLALGVVSLYPAVRVVTLSFERRVPVFHLDEFVGVANYVFLAHDAEFWNAVWVSVRFTVASVLLELMLGVLAALAVERQRAARPVAIGLLLLPWCLPGVVTARTFEWLLHPTDGLVNRLGGGLAINWLGDPAWALVALIGADVWRTTPFVALLALARLTAIAPEIYEAAAVDGASRTKTFRSITLPLLAPVLVVVALFRTLDAIRAFDLPYVLTGGGPASTTETVTLYAYRSLFQTLQLGFGAAVATVIFVLVVLVAWLYLYWLEREEAHR